MGFYKKILLLCLCQLSLSLPVLAEKNDRWDGKTYLNNSDLQYQWATSYIKKFQLQGHEKILDIGCGDGRVTAVIAHSLPNGFVVGIDTSESMLEVARGLKNKVRLGNLDFIRQNAMTLTFENEFDFIVSFSCFHWIHDHFAVLQGMEKALKPNGKTFLYFCADYGHNRLDHAINAVAEASKWSPYFTDFTNPCFLITPSKFVTYAEEVGLKVNSIENIIVDETFSDKAAFAAWMTGWMSHLKHLPIELHQEFLEEIIDNYLINHPLDSENKLHYIGYWVEAELLKN